MEEGTGATEFSGEKEEGSELVEEGVQIAERLLSYFETLFLYWQKVFGEKLSKTTLLTFLILFFLFLLCTGTGFFVYAGYHGLLQYFDGDLIKASLSMGSFLLISSLIFVFFILKKMEA